MFSSRLKGKLLLFLNWIIKLCFFFYGKTLFGISCIITSTETSFSIGFLRKKCHFFIFHGNCDKGIILFFFQPWKVKNLKEENFFTIFHIDKSRGFDKSLIFDFDFLLDIFFDYDFSAWILRKDAKGRITLISFPNIRSESLMKVYLQDYARLNKNNCFSSSLSVTPFWRLWTKEKRTFLFV